MSIAEQKLPAGLHQLLSDQLGPMQRRIDRLKRRYRQLWCQMPTSFPAFERCYTIDQQHDLERRATALLNRMTTDADNRSQDAARFKARIEAVAP